MVNPIGWYELAFMASVTLNVILLGIIGWLLDYYLVLRPYKRERE